ncbi:MAG: flagellar regulator YcgR PilZN domain-containing protein [Ketobacteraceae bacterium]|nr:flagellar regulator YcgR PilZN domain-containing protein [Ketobacteraceae bacterium]
MKLTELFRIPRKPTEAGVVIREKDYLRMFQLMRGHALLQLRLAGDSHRYQTVLLEVNADEGYLLIDQPFPHDGVLSGAFEQAVVLEYDHDGFTTRIRTVVSGRVDEDDDTYFRLAWPDTVEEAQRRDQFRLDVTRSWNREIDVSGIDNQRVSAVMDLSATGMRIALEGNQVDSIYAGRYLENVVLTLKGCAPIQCHLDITHCHYVPDAELGSIQTTVAGGRLEGISERDRENLQRFIHSAQRQQLRKQAEISQSARGLVAA